MSKKTMKKVIAIALAVVLVACIIIFGPSLLEKIRGNSVNVYPVSELSISDYYEDSSTASGTVGLYNMQKIYNSDTKTITEIYVTEGQSVKVGDKLLSYDTTLSEIDLEKAKLSVQKLQLQLSNAQTEYNTLLAMKPHSEIIVTPSWTVTYNTVETPYIAGGSGTEDDPLYVVWGFSDSVDDSFLKQCLTRMGYNKASGEAPTVCANLVVRDMNATNGEVLTSYYVELKNDGSSLLSFTIGEASLSEEILAYDKEPEDYIEEYGSDYTEQELIQMRSEKSDEIKSLETQVKSAELTLKQKQQEASEDTVYATIDGTVTAVRTVEQAKEDNKAIVEVSAGGGYLITASISEYMRDSIKVGDTVTVTSWWGSGSYDGTIKEIGEKPADSTSSYSSDSNVTYYPFTVSVDSDAELTEDESVEISYTPQSETEVSGFYIDKMFLRTENGAYYCYVENNGKLEKRTLSTGKIVGDSYIQIKSGLTTEDYVAFPYGNSVKDGATAKEADTSELYN